jgi:segregation and condensation protein A
MSIPPATLATHNRALGAAYPIALPVFQGPLELLLRLIEKEELDISAISLVALTDQYLQTIEQLEEREPGALADFLVVASKLLYIKSRSLLPQAQPLDEDEEEDPSAALIKQLLEYRQFKAVAASLLERAELGLRTYARHVPRPTLEKKLNLDDLTLAQLQTALHKALNRMPNAPLPQVKTYPITVAEQIEVVHAYFREGRPRVRFDELLGQQATRLEVIVTFLAVLELIKQRELVAVQERTFGVIVLVAYSEAETL